MGHSGEHTDDHEGEARTVIAPPLCRVIGGDERKREQEEERIRDGQVAEQRVVGRLRGEVEHRLHQRDDEREADEGESRLELVGEGNFGNNWRPKRVWCRVLATVVSASTENTRLVQVHFNPGGGDDRRGDAEDGGKEARALEREGLLGSVHGVLT